MVAPIEDRLLTLREAAEVLRLSTRTVREYLKRGDISGKIIGKQWRFRQTRMKAIRLILKPWKTWLRMESW
jgi:excisionase family DNA binding protein